MLIKMNLPERIDNPHHCEYENGHNNCWDKIFSMNQPLVRGMEIDKQELANIMKEFRKNQPIMKYSMELMAQHIIDNSIRWLKEAV